MLQEFRNMPKDYISAMSAKLTGKHVNDLTDSLEDQIHQLNKICSATLEDDLDSLGPLNAMYSMELKSIYGHMHILS